MKNHLLLMPRLFALLLLITATACKEEAADPLPQPHAPTVTIAGTSYATVTIGNQTWTAANYAGPGGVPYNAANEKPEYGRYYTYAEAQAVPLPAGWRIPTEVDYIRLAVSQGVVVTNYRATRQEAIKKLISKTNWRNANGDNSSGFNAYPAGYCFRDAAPQDGDVSEFWVADGKTLSIQEGVTAHNLSFYAGSSDPIYRFNLRFVKDN